MWDLALTTASVVFGSFTVIFIAGSLRNSLKKLAAGASARRRSLIAAVACSGITGILMTYELASSIQALINR